MLAATRWLAEVRSCCVTGIRHATPQHEKSLAVTHTHTHTHTHTDTQTHTRRVIIQYNPRNDILSFGNHRLTQQGLVSRLKPFFGIKEPDTKTITAKQNEILILHDCSRHGTMPAEHIQLKRPSPTTQWQWIYGLSAISHCWFIIFGHQTSWDNLGWFISDLLR